MGFCLFDTVAIAARHAQKALGMKRVAIVDWDVHHGNGTQAIFWSALGALCLDAPDAAFPWHRCAVGDRRRQYLQRAALAR